MNKPLICRLLGLIALLIGGSMVMSLPWAFPPFGPATEVEVRGIAGLLGAMAVCGAVGAVLMRLGRGGQGAALFRREAIAVVGLSWLLATVLGALPFWFSATASGRDADGRPIRMNVVDGLFESASGFTGTGATVLTNLEDPELIPRAILFWRSQTHFLGGLGIMVLFVAILGMGSAGKALMLTEMPGPSQESTHARTQRAAWIFASIFIGLVAVLTDAAARRGNEPVRRPVSFVRHDRHRRFQHARLEHRVFPQRHDRDDDHAVHDRRLHQLHALVLPGPMAAPQAAGGHRVPRPTWRSWPR